MLKIKELSKIIHHCSYLSPSPVLFACINTTLGSGCCPWRTSEGPMTSYPSTMTFFHGRNMVVQWTLKRWCPFSSCSIPLGLPHHTVPLPTDPLYPSELCLERNNPLSSLSTLPFMDQGTTQMKLTHVRIAQTGSVGHGQGQCGTGSHCPGYCNRAGISEYYWLRGLSKGMMPSSGLTIYTFRTACSSRALLALSSLSVGSIVFLRHLWKGLRDSSPPLVHSVICNMGNIWPCKLE